MTTAERMKARRKEIGVSAEEIAKELKVSPATIYRYEKGDIEKMPLEILEPLSKVLRLSLIHIYVSTACPYGTQGATSLPRCRCCLLYTSILSNFLSFLSFILFLHKTPGPRHAASSRRMGFQPARNNLSHPRPVIAGKYTQKGPASLQSLCSDEVVSLGGNE